MLIHSRMLQTATAELISAAQEISRLLCLEIDHQDGDFGPDQEALATLDEALAVYVSARNSYADRWEYDIPRPVMTFEPVDEED